MDSPAVVRRDVKRQRREDDAPNLSQQGMKVEASSDGVASSVQSDAEMGAKPKRALDIDALKRKLAEDKLKLSLMKVNRKMMQESQQKSSTLAQVLLPLTTVTDPYRVERTVPSNAVNLRYQQEETTRRLKRQKREERMAVKTKQSQQPDAKVDRRMPTPQFGRKKKILSFLEPGALTRKAEEQAEEIFQMKLTREKLQRSLSAQIDETGQPVRVQPKPSKIPDVEWWDMPYLMQEKEEGQEGTADAKSAEASASVCYDVLKVRKDVITNVIEHPELTYPQAEPPSVPPPPIMLTRAEQKRICKQNRKRIQEERREEVLLGIRPPQKGRVRIANMMRVLGEAVHDPTAVERKVRAEMAARASRHEARNQERKLTPEQRKEKESAKLLEDTSLKSSVAVFKVLSLANPRNRFKVDIEANKNMLTGCVLLGNLFVLVIVEGGPKAIQRYKKLMKKIKWTEEIPPPKNQPSQSVADESGGSSKRPPPERVLGANIPPSENKCWLVWEGDALRRAFTNFRFEALPNKPRKFLEKLGIAHYWDLALNYQHAKSA